MSDLIRRIVRALTGRKSTLPTVYTAPTAQTEAYFAHERVTLLPPAMPDESESRG